MLLDEGGLQGRVARMETLLGEIETLDDPSAKSKAAEVVGVLLDLYGEGLARMMEVVAEGEDREKAFDAFAGDELVSHLLLLHGLHPLDLETRVAVALEVVRPYLQSHGGNVELMGIEGGVARLRLEGSCNGCPSSTMTLKLAIEEAVQNAAPDLDGIEAAGAELRSRANVAEEEETAGSERGSLDGHRGDHTLRRRDAGQGDLRRAGAVREAGQRSLCLPQPVSRLRRILGG